MYIYSDLQRVPISYASVECRLSQIAYGIVDYKFLNVSTKT